MTESEEKNRIESSTLYLVATPVGNLSDLSPRAVKILSSVTHIAAEDTRVTAKLLSCYDICYNDLFSYRQNNRVAAGEKIIDMLRTGDSVAIVTDAGTPAVSDPGQDIVRMCIENGFKVTSAPGACAAVNALILSGLPTDQFKFWGFGQPFDVIMRESSTSIVYSAPHDLLKTLRGLCEYDPDRKIAVCREMTKLNEEIIRCTIHESVEHFTEIAPRGEFVIVVSGCPVNTECFWTDMSIEQHVLYYTDRLGFDKMTAIKQAARDRGLRKNDVYSILNK